MLDFFLSGLIDHKSALTNDDPDISNWGPFVYLLWLSFHLNAYKK